MNIRRSFLTIILILGTYAIVFAQAAINFSSGHTSRDESNLYPTGTQVNVELSGTGINWAKALAIGDFTIYNAPQGVSITGVSEVNTTVATLTLTCDTDFDIAYSSITVTVSEPTTTHTDTLMTDNTLEITADTETATFGPSNPTTLTERSFEAGTAYIHINLGGDEMFVNHANLDTTDFTLVGFPAGITLSSMVTTSSPKTGDYQAVIIMKYYPGDFDSDVTGSISINPSVLVQSTSALSTGNMTITALDETAAATDSLNLSEQTLNTAWVELTLGNDETLLKSQSLGTTGFVLNNFPTGTTVEDATSNAAGDKITVDLNYTHSVDMDAPITNASIDIPNTVLKWNTTDAITSSDFVIGYHIESVSETASSNLDEANLNDGSITLTLDNDLTNVTGPITSPETHFTLINFPTGTSIESVNSTGTEITILLDFTGDFDNTITDAQIAVSQSILTYNLGGPLTADISDITAATVTADITEASRLESQLYTSENVIEVVLSGTGFENPVPNRTIANTQFTLTDAPPGVSISFIETTGTNTAEVTLTNDTDFDTPYPSAYIVIHDDEVTSEIGNLTTDFIAFNELIESADLTSDPAQLDESNIDGTSYIVIPLANETFEDYTLLSHTDFTLVGFPPDVSLTGMKTTGLPLTTDTEAVIFIDYTPGDFDIPYSSAQVSIPAAELVQSTAPLLTDVIEVQALVEDVNLTDSINLYEFNLHNGSITLTLDNDVTNVTGPITSPETHFALNNFPGGTSIESVNSDGTNITILLDFAPGTDFDTDILNATVTVNSSILTFSKVSPLTTDPFAVRHSAESVALTDSINLYEVNLHDGSITLTLTNDVTSVTGPITSPETHFSLNNFPTGTGIESVNSDGTNITILLDFAPGVDFDTDITDATVSVLPSILTYNKGSSLTTDPFAVRHSAESVALTDSINLYEVNLHNGSVTLTLTNDATSVTGPITSPATHFSLNNFPTGISIESASSDGTNITILLDFALGVDFDLDITDATVSVLPSILTYNKGGSLTTGIFTVYASIESVAISNTSNLAEQTLNNGMVELTLTNDETPVKGNELNATDFVFDNLPGGTSIDSIGSDATGKIITILLDYTPGDFDNNITNAQVTVLPATLTYNKGGSLVTGSFTITALTEYVTRTASTNLDEQNLDLGTIELELTNDQTLTSGELDSLDFSFVNFPPGISIDSIGADLGRTVITIELNFDNYYDFDDPIDNAAVAVKQSILTWNKTDALTTLDFSITDYDETPEAFMTPSSWLREFFLDTMTMDLKFEEEVFLRGITLATTDFVIENGPIGLSINGLTNIADSSVTLELLFDGTDYDDSLTNVMVAIRNEVLLQQEIDFLRTDPFTIKANIEPVVSDVTITNDTAMIDDVVMATINLSEYTEDSVYILVPGATIGGYSVDSMKWVSHDQYNAWFTIAEGGTDYLVLDDVPVAGLQLNDPPVPGITHSSSISQNADLLDANRPVVQKLSIIGQGDKQIGDEVIILVSAFEEGLLPEDTTEINGVLMSESNMVFEEIGGGTYTMIYTIETGNQNVSAGALQSKVYLRDYAGNINKVYPAIDANSLSVDANVPVIYSMTNTTPEDTVIIGGEVTLSIVADESGYTLADDSEVNGVKGDGGLAFSSIGSTYFVKYIVEENDPIVPEGELKAKIILQDGAGNRSLTDSVIINNDVTILTQRPRGFLTGNDEICIYDTASLFITLEGEEPWKVKYLDDKSNVYYINDITETEFTLFLDPQVTTTYTIDTIWDGTGNFEKGTGTSVVVVNPLPVVSIIGLISNFSVNDKVGADLVGDPTGGAFYGPGVVTQTSHFSPDVAGLTEGVPHWIRYEYIDAKGCFKADSQSVEVVKDSVQFFWPDAKSAVLSTACYLDDSYRLRALNTAGTEGSFSIQDATYPSGFMVKTGVNEVTFDPSKLDWSTKTAAEFSILYNYLDNDGVPLSRETEIDIEYFETAIITPATLPEGDVCSNESVKTLSGNWATGIFTGPGIEEIEDAEAEFYPALADTGNNWIYYTYTSPYNCVQQDSAMIVVHEAPTPEFEFINTCVMSNGGLISFSNITDTTGLNGNLEWVWNFGDIPSGEANRAEMSTMGDTSHFYPGAGRRTVTLTATVLETGCTSFESITKDLGNTPVVTIDWNTECFTNTPVTFTGTSLTDDSDSIFRWRVTDLNGTVIKIEEGGGLTSLDYNFITRDIYSVEFTAITAKNCFASIADTIYLRPYISNITDNTPYSEDFDGNATGWYAFGQETSPQNSWELSTVNASEFPFDLPAGSTKAWYTDLVRKDTFEQSFVSSPCFDFSNMRRPMISFDRKISSDRDRDGAALQYTIDDGKSWNNIGAVDDGSINWYNTFRIQNGPGGQGEGWTGGFIFDPSEPWLQSRHSLDVLIGQPRVQFRIAYGSAGASVVENEGFAFDNFWIGERSRIVLIEHFTNSADANSNDQNMVINNLVKNNPLDVIDIQYHAELGEEDIDQMNKDNPAPASARSLFYSTQKVPYALFDGGLDDMAYDFDINSAPFDTLDLFTRALVDPSFDILLNVDDVEEGSNAVDINIDVKALEALPEAEYVVYAVIIERLITDQAYWGPRSTDRSFRNAVRAMVPNAAGTSLLRSWNPGDIEKLTLKWDISDKIVDNEMISVVVFVQGAENHKVYQTASNDPGLGGKPVVISVQDYLKSNELSMVVYPNPARTEAYLVFDEALTEKMEIQLFRHTGSIVSNALIPAGTESYVLDVSGIKEGVYFIRAVQRNRIIGTHRLMIIR